MNQYELAILYHPDLESDLAKTEEKVTKLITANGGKVTGTDSWGLRRLAYKIKGVDQGIYVFYSLDLPSESVKKLNANLNITDEVIRFLISKPDFKKAAAAEALKAEKAKKAAEHDETHAEQSGDDGEE
jgi:small subunit ribosomal protein S6